MIQLPIKKDTLFCLKTLICFLLYSLLYIFILKSILDIPYVAVIEAHKERLCTPNSDLFTLKNIKDFHIYSFTYFFMVLIVTSLYIFAIINYIGKNFSTARSIKRTILLFMFFCFFLLTFLQQSSRYNVLTKDFAVTKKRSESDKKSMLFKEEYEFAIRAKNKLSGRHQAEFLTDLKCDEDPCIINSRIIKYFLYPEVTIGFDNKTKKDVNVLYFVNDPQKYINDKDEILVNMNNEYILTLRK
ncbi:MAG: hypothetical protein A2Y03_09240 [Omnitrophica WOR_2 bacterium GWF2_38_59]|nr:MAG: hypothetical protein A2Y03_09240 [Omnitrophica WOR_2 bacterium GWF2_38_59]OGX50591.1 MAG: hypothetical protein A2267_02900 [Omnitrophica WOR_2 bacterium RIFOXYA12_FULL_38_10]OGX51108.1 MAG: hypothetical protein A2243_08170 [Omnitrophica WOR_2 bacterium RIFOXYA2_FULL_38_17]OGX56131.1 MAG: hypothetical protein A2447_07680 [Omnitrophica WOR_2 bacterium RIFOXYC2_FULL_38_12]OGX60432.1 MAG: hypothetical protein A2306_09280 [Omnitrophica WOR_2 bacterium RIFOXYB2_FULL_38_16]HBG60894.1 hypothet